MAKGESVISGSTMFKDRTVEKLIKGLPVSYGKILQNVSIKT